MPKRCFSLMNTDYVHSEVTGEVIGAAYAVYNTLGHGFLEKVYENALVVEMGKRGVRVQTQTPIEIRYAGQVVGEYVADLIVEGKVIVEVKAMKALDGVAEAQVLNYLRATGLKVGLLINFGPEVEIKRLIF